VLRKLPWPRPKLSWLAKIMYNVWAILEDLRASKVTSMGFFSNTNHLGIVFYLVGDIFLRVFSSRERPPLVDGATLDEVEVVGQLICRTWSPQNNRVHLVECRNKNGESGLRGSSSRRGAATKTFVNVTVSKSLNFFLKRWRAKNLFGKVKM